MNKSFLTTFVAGLLLATALAPLAASEPAGEKQTIAPFAGMSVKGLFGFGASACSFGIPCTHPEFATFDTTGWDQNQTSRSVTFWANWREGVFGVGDTGGFEMTACSDRDDNSICANFGGDDYADTYSNEAIHSTTPCDKDDKDCGDNTDAEIVMCIHRDTAAGMSDFDNVFVFIGQWADVGLGGNVGAGISAGTYDVYMDAGAYGC